MNYWFQEVPADQVKRELREAAQAMLAHVERDLELPELQIRWIRQRRGEPSLTDKSWMDIHGPRKQRGLTQRDHPTTMWVRATLNPFWAAMTVAHEARHLWQLRHPQLWPLGNWDKEPDAKNYENELLSTVAEIVAEIMGIKKEE